MKTGVCLDEKLLPQWPCLSFASSNHSNWCPVLLDPWRLPLEDCCLMVPDCWGDKGSGAGMETKMQIHFGLSSLTTFGIRGQVK